jgi:hypothetical protein
MRKVLKQGMRSTGNDCEPRINNVGSGAMNVGPGRVLYCKPSVQLGVPGVISGKFTVRKIATKSPSVAGHAYSPKKQDVVLSVTSYTERDVSVLGSKTCRVTPVYRPS